MRFRYYERVTRNTTNKTMNETPTPRMTPARRVNHFDKTLPKYVVPFDDASQLERELAEARSMTEGQWLLKVAARLVTAGCKSDGIVDALDELIQQRDTLADACRKLMKVVGAPGTNEWQEIKECDAAYLAGKKALATMNP